uniref:Protein kinase domain-containing protein n=1 Tax=Loa loa TaxID=7209 RepID=A0A1I7VNI8_LOALO
MKKMHVLLVPHAFELCTAAIIMLVLMLWPIYICREITDIELEKAYINDKQCALELHEHLELVQNDTIVQILQRFDDGTDNITWLNIQHEYHYQKSSVNSICAMLGFRERFGTANGQLGSALTIIDFNWNGTNKMLRNLGAPFPLEWKISKYIAWFWACIKIIELLLANCCQNIIIKFDKPISLMIVDLSTDYVFLDENAPPYPNEYNTMDSAVDLM